MCSRREALLRSAQLASMLAGLGLLPRIVSAQAAAQVQGQAAPPTLVVAGATTAWNAVAFEAKSVADVMNALGAAMPVASAEVALTAPDIAENGAVVPVAVSVALPGVKRILLLVEKNPATLSAVFDVTAQVEPALSTRVKMGQTSNVFAVAITGDDRVFYASKEVKVTLGGCGG